MNKTLKALYPEWEGGVNPNYILGAKIMDLVVPPSQSIEEVEVPVATADNDNLLQRDNGVDAAKVLKAQTKTFAAMLETKQPDKVLTIGGDCAVSLTPFNYLSQKYGKDLGIIWLDAHPDISTTDQSHHLHEMVVSSLLGKGAPDFNIQNPLNNKQVLLAGLVKESLRPMDNHVKDYNVQVLTPERLKEDTSLIKQWIDDNNFTKIAVHFDLDVLSPGDYRSIYPAEPGINRAAFPAAIGKLNLETVGTLLKQIDTSADLVGLTIAENMAWDSLRLQRELSDLSLFM